MRKNKRLYVLLFSELTCGDVFDTILDDDKMADKLYDTIAKCKGECTLKWGYDGPISSSCEDILELIPEFRHDDLGYRFRTGDILVSLAYGGRLSDAEKDLKRFRKAMTEFTCESRYKVGVKLITISP